MGYILEATDVIKQYKQYDHVITAVDRASFQVKDGEFVAIIGSSGSGKSTLLHLCGGLDSVNSGTILVRGQNITKMSTNQLATFRGTYTGFVFQKHNLLPQFSALENIMLPTTMLNKPEFKYEEHLKKLIDLLDIENRLNHLPSELSGGQQQKIAIARALINRPQILFADEPTGNLDKKSAEDVLKLLLYTRELFGQTILIVTHDFSIAKKADRIFEMSNGRLQPYQ